MKIDAQSLPRKWQGTTFKVGSYDWGYIMQEYDGKWRACAYQIPHASLFNNKQTFTTEREARLFIEQSVMHNVQYHLDRMCGIPLLPPKE